MINASLNIAWSIAEIEASAAGFEAILPNHFWIGCCKGCDLNYAKFLQNANPEIRGMETQIARDFQAVRDALAAGNAKPAELRRAMRGCLGKEGKGSVLMERGRSLPIDIHVERGRSLPIDIHEKSDRKGRNGRA
jgi:hypothetical protein